MEITHTGSDVTITGNIKSVNDYQQIKNTLDSIVETSNYVTLNIKDSISITSSVIGYLNKLVLKDGIDLHMVVGNPQLYELLDELNLISVFHVRNA